jgi:multidrug efflux pump subunit AcrA (membrane-fusion protein)
VKRQFWLTIWIVVVLSIAAALGSGCAKSKATVVVEGGGIAPPATETPPAAFQVPTGNVIMMDGELASAYPELTLAFPGSAGGRLAALHVQVGQHVKKGDPLALLDDGELRREVSKAEIALQRALEDQEKGQGDIDRTYQREASDAETQYAREQHDAERQYDRELEDARRALEQAQHDLQVTLMQPPTTALSEAEVELTRALDTEATAEDDYKQALDRPWEDQGQRDRLYKEWQARIVDRKLAQLRLEDAQVQVQVHELELAAKRQAVEDARADLARVEQDAVDREVVEKEVNLEYARAVEDARTDLAEAQEDLENARLVAPWEGLVLSTEAAAGAQVDAGQAVVTLLNLEEVYFITENLSERHIERIGAGQRARVTLRAYPDATLSGQVEAVIPKMDRQSESDPRFVAYIRLGESELELLPGMSGRVEVIIE